jgi:ribosomal protein L35
MKEVTLQNYNKDKYYPKVVNAVGKILETRNEVSPIDIFLTMGMLEKKKLEIWKNGQVQYLEQILHGSLSKLNRVLRILRFHAHDLNLSPKIAQYKRGNRILRFTKTGNTKLEEAYCRHFVVTGKPSASKRRGCSEQPLLHRDSESATET